MAAKVQNNLIKSTKLSDRQVRQAGYWVLYKVAMPSILVELGFLSNAQEEAFLIQEGNKKLMATAICNAFIDYKNGIEGTNIPLVGKSEAPTVAKTEPQAPKTTEKPQTPKETKPETSLKLNQKLIQHKQLKVQIA